MKIGSEISLIAQFHSFTITIKCSDFIRTYMNNIHEYIKYVSLMKGTLYHIFIRRQTTLGRDAYFFHSLLLLRPESLYSSLASQFRGVAEGQGTIAVIRKYPRD